MGQERQDQQLRIVEEMRQEMNRVDEMLDAYEAEIKAHDYTFNGGYRPRYRSLLKRRVADLKYTLTKLVRQLYEW